MPETRLNWEPVVRSLVHCLMSRDIIPVAVYDGAYRTAITRASTKEMAVATADAACAVDEASLRCIWITASGELRCSLLLVFGNEPDELVADYSWQNGDDALEAAIEEALEDFQAEWHGIPCPRVALSNQATA